MIGSKLKCPLYLTVRTISIQERFFFLIVQERNHFFNNLDHVYVCLSNRYTALPGMSHFSPVQHGQQVQPPKLSIMPWLQCNLKKKTTTNIIT